MKLIVRHGQGELVVPSQKEFLLLFQRGFIAPDDQVQRDGRGPWIAAKDLPWIRGTALDEKQDNRRLFGLTLGLMVAGLIAIVWMQAHYAGKSAAAKSSSSKSIR
jgi:hypothetical protein